MRANSVYFKIRGYRKFLCMLRCNYKSSNPWVDLKPVYLMFVQKNSCVKLHCNAGIRFRNLFLQAQVRRCLSIYAFWTAFLRPCVLFGKSWVAYQSYFPDLPNILSATLNVISSVPPSFGQKVRSFFQYVSFTAVISGVGLGVAMFPIMEEIGGQYKAGTNLKAIEHIKDLLKMGAISPEEAADRINSLNRAYIHCTDRNVRDEASLRMSKDIMDTATKAGVNDDLVRSEKQKSVFDRSRGDMVDSYASLAWHIRNKSNFNTKISNLT